VKFEIVDDIQFIEVIAVGSHIRDLAYLQKIYGHGRWRKLKGSTFVKLPNGNIRHVELHWYEAHGIGRKESKSSGIWIKPMTTGKQFVLCVDNTDYEASLITRKVYEVIPDEQAEKDDLIRIIDESGEDYLYHTSQFVFIELPIEIEQALVAA